MRCPAAASSLFTSSPGVLSQIFVTAQVPCGPQLSAVRAAAAERDGATALTPSPAAQHWPPPPSEQGSPPLPSRVSPAQALATSAYGLCSQEGRHHHLLLLGMWLPSASFFQHRARHARRRRARGRRPALRASRLVPGTMHCAAARLVFVFFRRTSAACAPGKIAPSTTGAPRAWACVHAVVSVWPSSVVYNFA